MIGNRLYLLRKAAGLSQAELGDMLSVSHHTISAYEKEKSDPSDATKVWLARFFGVSVDYLMGLSDDRRCRRLFRCIAPARGAYGGTA